MNYLTAKESRVEKAWSKRGLAGLRSELLFLVEGKDLYDWDDEMFVLQIATRVFSCLPTREWSRAEPIIRETCGLGGVDIDKDRGMSTIVMKARLSEETLREDIGDE